jgi:hypothetical protein
MNTNNNELPVFSLKNKININTEDASGIGLSIAKIFIKVG